MGHTSMKWRSKRSCVALVGAAIAVVGGCSSGPGDEAAAGDNAKLAASQVCCTAAEGGSCTATCPAGTTVQAVSATFGASQCTNLPSCSGSGTCSGVGAGGASCKSQPSCLGQSSCTFGFSNTSCGDSCVGYAKTGGLVVSCGAPTADTT